MTEPTAPVISSLLERCQSLHAQGRVPVAVFDLDHTLFDNGPRTWQILLEFAESSGRHALRDALDRLPRLGLPYLMRDILARCGLHDDDLHDAAVDFWRARFFTDEYQRYDVPLTGAVDFVVALYQAGTHIVYLSGRDSPGMLVGCAASLRQHRFPVGLVRTSIVLKHDFETPDLAFKTEAVQYIQTLGDVIASFDNEPANCNLFHESWPNATNVFVRTAHAPNPPPLLAGLTLVDDFLFAEAGTPALATAP